MSLAKYCLALLAAVLAGVAIGLFLAVVFSGNFYAAPAEVWTGRVRPKWVDTAEQIYMAASFFSMVSGLSWIWMDYEEQSVE